MEAAFKAVCGRDEQNMKKQELVLTSLRQSTSLAIATRQSLNEPLYCNLYNLIILLDEDLAFAGHWTGQETGAEQKDLLHRWRLSNLNNRSLNDAKALQALRYLAGKRLAYLLSPRNQLDQALSLCNAFHLGLEELLENVDIVV